MFCNNTDSLNKQATLSGKNEKPSVSSVILMCMIKVLINFI
jgi:hypothetical protein